MAGTNRARHQRLLRESEGYLELGLPLRALDTLGRIVDPGSFRGHQQFLVGEALRALERYAEAIGPLSAAGELNPSNLDVWLALGWCHKRTGRLDRAIAALERALEIDEDNPLLHYNLACYFSLDRQKEPALRHLALALDRKPEYREMIPGESDFDPLRADPEFQALLTIVV